MHLCVDDIVDVLRGCVDLVCCVMWWSVECVGAVAIWLWCVCFFRAVMIETQKHHQVVRKLKTMKNKVQHLWPPQQKKMSKIKSIFEQHEASFSFCNSKYLPAVWCGPCVTVLTETQTASSISVSQLTSTDAHTATRWHLCLDFAGGVAYRWKSVWCDRFKFWMSSGHR